MTKHLLKIFLVLLILSILAFLLKKNQLNNITLVPPQEIKTINIGLIGDMGFGRVITATARSKKDFSWSFSGVSNWLQENDFNLANLESPIINNCPTSNNTTFIFCGDPRFLPQLTQNKFILNLSNNHILNYGQKGLKETQDLLNQNNVDFVYSHQSSTEFIIKNFNNISFGFLGFDLTGNHKIDNDQILKLVEKYNPEVDWLIVSLHWGNEYLPQPEKWRVDLAHQLVDIGADIIHGHHPHVLQPQEIYKNKIIFYSLGNFIFDQNWSKATSESEMIRLTLTKDEIINLEKTPIQIKYNSRPEIVN